MSGPRYYEIRGYLTEAHVFINNGRVEEGYEIALNLLKSLTTKEKLDLRMQEDILSLAAKACENKKQYVKALKFNEMILEINPFSWRSHLSKISLYRTLDETNEMEKGFKCFFETAAKASNETKPEGKDYAKIYTMLSIYWCQDAKKSMRFAKCAIKLDPLYAPGFSALAHCYQELGCQTEANLYFYKAYLLDPDRLERLHGVAPPPIPKRESLAFILSPSTPTKTSKSGVLATTTTTPQTFSDNEENKALEKYAKSTCERALLSSTRSSLESKKSHLQQRFEDSPIAIRNSFNGLKINFPQKRVSSDSKAEIKSPTNIKADVKTSKAFSPEKVQVGLKPQRRESRCARFFNSQMINSLSFCMKGTVRVRSSFYDYSQRTEFLAHSLYQKMQDRLFAPIRKCLDRERQKHVKHILNMQRKRGLR